MATVLCRQVRFRPRSNVRGFEGQGSSEFRSARAGAALGAETAESRVVPPSCHSNIFPPFPHPINHLQAIHLQNPTARRVQLRYGSTTAHRRPFTPYSEPSRQPTCLYQANPFSSRRSAPPRPCKVPIRPSRHAANQDLPNEPICTPQHPAPHPIFNKIHGTFAIRPQPPRTHFLLS